MIHGSTGSKAAGCYHLISNKQPHCKSITINANYINSHNKYPNT